MTTRTSGLRALMLSGAAGFVLSGPVQADTDATMSFDIQAQDLASALKQFATSTNKEILFSPELVKDRQASAVSGTFTPTEALGRLLGASGLSFDEVAPNVFVVKPKNPQQSAVATTRTYRLAQHQTDAPAQADSSVPARLGPSGAAGSPAVITGRVTDISTGAPLAGAVVSVQGTSLTTSTDARGEYRLPAVPAGRYELLVQYLGLDAQSIEVTVEPGERIARNFSLGHATETIVVMGSNRSSLAQALNQQRAAPNSATVVSADLLGSFPAETVSEALRRVPGVAFGRDADTGEGSKVTVRGFSSEAINIQLNGLELQGTGFNRSIDLSSFLADNISQITIHKTLLPSHEATGSGGLVEIETRSGLDYGDRYFTMNLEREWSVDDEFGDEPEIAATAAWKFTPTFGVAGTVQYRETDRRSYDVTRLGQLPEVLPAGYTNLFSLPASYKFPFDPEFDDQWLTGANYLERLRDESNLTASLTFGWDVAEHTTLRLDLQRSELDTTLTTSNASHGFLAGSGGFDMPIPELGGEVRRRMVITGLRPALTLIEQDKQSELTTISLRGDTVLNQWEFGYKLGKSRAASRTHNQSINLTGANATNVADLIDPATLVMHPDDDAAGTLRVVDGGVVVAGDRIPVLALTQAGWDHLFSPSTYAVSSATRSFTNSPAESIIGELSARFNFDSDRLSYIEWGAKFDGSERTNVDNLFATNVASLRSSESYVRIFGRDTLLSELASDPFLSKDLSIIGASGHEVRFLRADLVNDIFGQLANLVEDDPSTPENEARFNYTNTAALDPILDANAMLPTETTEDRYATYLEGMARFGKLEVVAGARYERIDRESVGVFTPAITLDLPGLQREPRETFVEAGLVNFASTGGTQETLTPSLLATYRQSDNLVFRLGYFRSTVHPDFRLLNQQPQLLIDMRPSFAHVTIREPNPDLKPTKTDNYDLDVAYYFKENPGLVRAAFFFKEVSNNFTSVLQADEANSTVRQRALEMLAPLQATRPDLLDFPENAEYRLNRPQNGEGGRIYGVELEAIRQLDFLPGFWRNFSVLGNVTFTDGDVPTLVSARDENGESITLSIDRALKDQSRWSGTASLAYEQGGFSGRLIYSYQSESVTMFDEYNLNTVIPEYDTLDLRMAYSFDGHLGRYTVFLEGDDLLKDSDDADIRQAIASTFGQGSPDFFFPTALQFNGGRTLTLGIRATF